MFSFSCCLSSSISYCWEYVVKIPWLSFGMQGRYADIILTFSLFIPPYFSCDQPPNPYESPPEWVIYDVKLVVEIINYPPGLLIVFQGVIVTDV